MDSRDHPSEQPRAESSAARALRARASNQVPRMSTGPPPEQPEQEPREQPPRIPHMSTGGNPRPRPSARGPPPQQEPPQQRRRVSLESLSREQLARALTQYRAQREIAMQDALDTRRRLQNSELALEYTEEQLEEKVDEYEALLGAFGDLAGYTIEQGFRLNPLLGMFEVILEHGAVAHLPPRVRRALFTTRRQQHMRERRGGTRGEETREYMYDSAMSDDDYSMYQV